ncbi:MAG: TetR/AcrR family transcriptional regulator [Acidobacteria bacterium]|nr:TetR/AcrR family transcriptional regulator [Acidobacteriota bacterium]
MPTDTKERLLDSAELLFSSQGIANTSLRSLTEHAKVNLAAVNYHFQSKDALVQAVLFRRMNPINQRRLELLSALQNPTVEQILDAFYRPAVEAVLAGPEGRTVARLIGRLYSEPGDLLAGQVRALMAEVIRLFVESIQRALPGVPPATVLWRLHFCIGILAHTFGAMQLIEGMARGRIAYDDPEAILRQMITFASAGLRAEGESTCAAS